jgi:methylmalonyl-CoA mutase
LSKHIVFDIDKSIRRALDTITRPKVYAFEDSGIDVARLLEKLPIETTPVYFHFNFISIDFVKQIDAIATNRNATIYCNLDQ